MGDSISDKAFEEQYYLFFDPNVPKDRLSNNRKFNRNSSTNVVKKESDLPIHDKKIVIRENRDVYNISTNDLGYQLNSTDEDLYSYSAFAGTSLRSDEVFLPPSNDQTSGLSNKLVPNGGLYNGKTSIITDASVEDIQAKHLENGEMLDKCEIPKKVNLTWEDGTCYRGGYLNNKPEGYGVYNNGKGCEFSGCWKNGLQHGVGLFTVMKGIPIVRRGYWEFGKLKHWFTDEDSIIQDFGRSDSIFQASSGEQCVYDALGVPDTEEILNKENFNSGTLCKNKSGLHTRAISSDDSEFSCEDNGSEVDKESYRENFDCGAFNKKDFNACATAGEQPILQDESEPAVKIENVLHTVLIQGKQNICQTTLEGHDNIHQTLITNKGESDWLLRRCCLLPFKIASAGEQPAATDSESLSDCTA